MKLLALVLSLLPIIPYPSLVREEKGSFRPKCDDLSAWTVVKESPALQREAYILDVGKKGVSILSGSEAGTFYAFETLRQIRRADGSIPCVHIEDAPAFDYRAMMLDCSRHFWTVEEIKGLLDVLASHKINTFHWHLTDDQGWRLEIKKYPELTRIGNYRPYTISWPGWNPDGWVPDGVPVDGYYTQDQVREVLAYAAERMITVIPEIEIPGHSTAALASYQWLGCKGEGYKVATKWLISKDVYCPGKESTFEFLEDVLSEVMELFPSEYIHIGGDECKKDEWKQCPHCQKRIADEGLADEKALQSYTIRRIERFVRSKGRSIIGWDEISEGGLSGSATVMSRFGPPSVRKYMSGGNQVILCPGYYCYFDYYQAEDNSREPRAHKGSNDHLTVECAYSFKPDSIYTARELRQVKGVECCLWTEYVPVYSHLQYMLLPRLDAFCEVAWTGGKARSWEEFLSRLKESLPRYDAAGINYARHCLEP